MLENAKWISYPTYKKYQCPIFKKSFSLNGEIKKATLTITSIGCYCAYINGMRVGEFVLAPGYTSRKRAQVQKYDVTSMLSQENVFTATVSGGWDKGRINWRADHDMPERYEALRLELCLTYKNGATEYINTDESWETSLSKITMADIYEGEDYDALFTEEYVGVKLQNYDILLYPQEGPEIREQERIAPHKIFTAPNGDTIIDFNQNLTGYFEFTVDAKAGERVSFSFAEVLDKDGNFYTENYRSARSEFNYVCKDGKQTYKPHHTFFGFRYMRVNSFPKEIEKSDVCAIVVHSDIKRTGYLSSSSTILNKLFSNIIWGQKGNFLDVPTDCPQRDERMGWTGDAQVFVRTASYNYDVNKFFEKWLTDLKLDQYENGGIPHVVPQLWGDDQSSAAWADASCICPWQLYLTYGNKSVLKAQFESMTKYIDYIRKISKNRYLWTGCSHYGDWLGLDAPAGSYKGSSREDFIASVFYAYSTSLVIKAGKVIGRGVCKYERLYEKIVSAIRKKYKSYKTQTECVLALYFDIAEDKEAVAKQLHDMVVANGGHLQTGFVGTPYLLHALSQNGYSELAYDLLLEEEYPSWLFSVRMGATTIWEHWDGINDKGEFWSKDMNSFNHYAYGAVADWVYGVACGIKTVEEKPGFERIIIAPTPTKKLSHLSASIETVRGTVSSSWTLEGDSFRYEITTPSPAEIIIDGVTYNVEKGHYVF